MQLFGKVSSILGSTIAHLLTIVGFIVMVGLIEGFEKQNAGLMFHKGTASEIVREQEPETTNKYLLRVVQ